MLAVIFDIVAGPQQPHDFDHFVRAFAAGVEVLSEQLEFILRPADADGQYDPVVGNDGRGRNRLGDQEGVAHRQHERVRRKTQPFGDGGERAHHHDLVGPVGEFGPAARPVRGIGIGHRERLGIHRMIRQGDHIPAGLIGGDRQLGQMGDRSEGTG